MSDATKIEEAALATTQADPAPDLIQWRWGARVRRLREAAGLFRREIQQVTGLTERGLAMLEGNQLTNPDYKTLRFLAIMFRLPTATFTDTVPAYWGRESALTEPAITEYLAELVARTYQAANKATLLQQLPTQLTPEQLIWRGQKTLIAARERMNLTQVQLHRLSGNSRNTIVRLEIGILVNPQYTTLSRLALTLNIPVGALVPEPSASLPTNL